MLRANSPVIGLPPNGSIILGKVTQPPLLLCLTNVLATGGATDSQARLFRVQSPSVFLCHIYIYMYMRSGRNTLLGPGTFLNVIVFEGDLIVLQCFRTVAHPARKSQLCSTSLVREVHFRISSSKIATSQYKCHIYEAHLGSSSSKVATCLLVLRWPRKGPTLEVATAGVIIEPCVS